MRKQVSGKTEKCTFRKGKYRKPDFSKVGVAAAGALRGPPVQSRAFDFSLFEKWTSQVNDNCFPIRIQGGG